MSLEQLVTSRANPRFKSIGQQIAASGLKRTHTLLLGEKLMEAWREAPFADRLIPELALSLDGAGTHPMARALRLDTLQLSESLMKDLADAGSPPRHALLARMTPDPSGPLAERVIAPWGIQDPGNLGAVLRSAAGFGFQEALLGPGCADPFSPKALRGTMGAAFLMQLRRAAAIPFDEGRWWALDGGPGAVPMADADLSTPLRILVGNEGHGWQQVEMPAHVRRLAIPIRGVESLNAAVAAGIACFDAARRNAW